jgi:hypothetical protein
MFENLKGSIRGPAGNHGEWIMRERHGRGRDRHAVTVERGKKGKGATSKADLRWWVVVKLM